MSVRLTAALLLFGLAATLLLHGPPAQRRIAADALIAPLRVGRPVTRGYVLSPPWRGSAFDVVYVARRAAGPDGPAGRVEVHIFDQGQQPGVAETRSFGVGWEVPPPGAMLAAPEEDARAVARTVAQAVAANDAGFASVDAVVLPNEHDPPPMWRVLDCLSGWRGALIGSAVALGLALLASLPGGAVAAGVLLFALGLALRLPALDVPFVHDQDVQRLFTGHLPLGEIATGAGLLDRHPPLYFFVLHVAEQLGQSEAVGRAPAVLAGALVGPALLLAAASMRGRIGPTAVLAALAVTISPELVERSREVSEIPLYGLLAVAAAASLVAALRQPRPLRLVVLALSHALALFTYYLAPFLVAAHTAVLAAPRPARRRVAAAFAVGVVASAPALALGLATFIRDRGAREVARAFPGLAWGAHEPAQMAVQMGRIAVGALGLPLTCLLLLAVAAGIVRRDVALVTPALGAAATLGGIALLAPLARVQAYYVATVLPLAVLALAVIPEPARLRARGLWLTALVLAIAGSTVPALGRARGLYLADADAFMPRFAALIAQRPERTVVTVAHYDQTLLTYYLARAAGRAVDWDSAAVPNAPRIESLLLVHALDAGSEAAAAQRLDELVAGGPLLVVQRDAFLLPRIAQRLAGCGQLAEAPTAQLYRCAPAGRPASSASAAVLP